MRHHWLSLFTFIFFVCFLTEMTYANRLAYAPPAGSIYFLPDSPFSSDTTSVVLKPAARKSKSRAVMFSLLVPGLGDLYLRDWNPNQWGKGQYFFITEIMMVSAVMYLHRHSDWIRKDSRVFASAHANVKWNYKKPSKYSTTIGKFNDIYAYNETQRRLSGVRFLMPETEAYAWRWDSETSRKKYDRMRARSLSERNKAIYITYGILANHLLSVVHASRTFEHLFGKKSFKANLMLTPIHASDHFAHGLSFSFSPVFP